MYIFSCGLFWPRNRIVGFIVTGSLYALVYSLILAIQVYLLFVTLDRFTE
jgi:hypothetical protein